MSEIKKKLKMPITVHGALKKESINAIRLNRVIFDFDSECVQISFGVGNIDVGEKYTQENGEVITKTFDEFSLDMQTLFSIDVVEFNAKILDYVETIIEESNKEQGLSMNDLQTQIVKEKVQKFMEELDLGDRNNRLSKFLLAGIGGYLDKLIMAIIQEIEKKKGE